MRFFQTDIKENYLVLLVGLVFVILNTLLIYFEVYYLPVLPILIAVIWLFFTSLEKGLFLIVFFVPFSIPLSKVIPGLPIDMFLPTEPLLAGVMILYFLKYLNGERIDIKILRHPLSLAIYFNLAWLFITSITSTMPLVSAKFLLARVWFIIAFYLLAAQIFKNPKRIRQYLWAYIIPFSIIILYVLIRHSTHGLNNQTASHWVVKPFYNDHTSYGAMLAMLLPVIIALFLTYVKMDVGQRILFFLFIGLFIAAILFSYTRAAWVSLMAIFGLWIVIKLRIKLGFLIMAGIIFGGILLSAWPRIMVKMEQNNQTSSGEITEHVKSISNVRNDDSNLERLNRWNSAIRMFKEKPFFGWGPGTYQFNYAPFQISHEKTSISTNTGKRGNAHSEYLGPLSESGGLGMISILIIFAVSIYTGLKVYFKSKTKHLKTLSLGVLLGLITYYIHGILNNFLDTDKASALVWGYMAILVAIDIYHMNTEEEPHDLATELKK
ncbi:MAG: O-antigen ligase family protein [Bacteroidales bacterium]|nr:O-antigen ligase family protein [Bacteroidales bacterium]MCF8391948.1 O-antigen ligase family protein [Bacteroidales bacterium]